MPRMTLLLAALGALITLVAAFGLYRILNPPAVDAWVNGAVTCPSRPEFGAIVAVDVPLYADPGRLQFRERIAHGIRVELLGTDGPTAYIRLDNREGYMDAAALTPYDPTTGIQPDPATC